LRVVLLFANFRAPNGGLPSRGASGEGSVTHPDHDTLVANVLWEIV
jgi:hypothetical protein